MISWMHVSLRVSYGLTFTSDVFITFWLETAAEKLVGGCRSQAERVALTPYLLQMLQKFSGTERCVCAHSKRSHTPDLIDSWSYSKDTPGDFQGSAYFFCILQPCSWGFCGHDPSNTLQTVRSIDTDILAECPSLIFFFLYSPSWPQ